MRFLILLTCLLFPLNAFATTYYVRDGGAAYGSSSTTCNGLYNVAYTSGNGPNCAIVHPAYVLGVYSGNASIMNGGDTLNIVGDSDYNWWFTVSGITTAPAVGDTYTNNGHTYTMLVVNVSGGSGTLLASSAAISQSPTSSGTLTRSSGSGDSTISFSASSVGQAQYKIGYGMPGGSSSTYCTSTGSTANCEFNQITAGTNASSTTNILGIGTNQPQLYGTQFTNFMLRDDTSNTLISNLELTSHSNCGYDFQANACPTSYPYGDFARDGIALGGSNNTLQNLYIHNMKIYGLYVENNTSSNITMTRLRMVGNGQGNFSTGNINNNGNWIFNQPISYWAGCEEAYPLTNAGIINPLNYSNCSGQSNGIIADGIDFGAVGTGNTAGNVYFYGPGSSSYNTKGGIDFLHGGDTLGTESMYVDKMLLEGNGGQIFKAASLTISVTNSILIGNCGWWYGATQTISGGMPKGDSCRAADGIAIAINGSSSNYYFINDTILSNFTNIFDFTNAATSSNIINLYNNIFVAGYSWVDSSGISGSPSDNTYTSFAAYSGSPKTNEDYNLFYVLAGNAGCNGAHDLCNTAHPGFTAGDFPMGTSGGGQSTFYQGFAGVSLVPISNTSAAKGAGNTGYTYWNNSNDYYDNTQSSPPSMGALNYNSTAANGYLCFFNSDCTGGSCTNNYCGGSCNSNGTSCSDGLTCCSSYCISGQCGACIANGQSGTASNCCSGLASGGTCVACIANGNSAASASQCCSGLISGGVCQAYICGDGIVTSPYEACDTNGPNLNGQTCASQGYNGGNLACNSGCLSFNTSGCTNNCLSATDLCSTNNQCCSNICSITSGSNGECVNSGGDITTGLIGWWKFDEGSGSTAIDSTGNGNTGTELNSPTYVTGIVGPYALNFNGTSQGIYANNFSTALTNLTVCMHVKTTASSTNFLFTLNRNPNAYVNEFVMQMTSGGKTNVYDYNGTYGFQNGNSNTAFNDGNAHDICFVKNGTSGAFYLDGNADGTTTASQNITYGKPSFSIGYDYRNSSNYWNGTIDEVRIWNRPLSSTDISTYHQYPNNQSSSSNVTVGGTSTIYGSF